MEVGRANKRPGHPGKAEALIMELKTIILDFDGTLVESVGIKDAAFEALFSEYPEHLECIMAYHLSHGRLLAGT